MNWCLAHSHSAFAWHGFWFSISFLVLHQIWKWLQLRLCLDQSNQSKRFIVPVSLFLVKSNKLQQNIDSLVLVCSFPPEYCEFSNKSTKCKNWLAENHPDLFSKYYSDRESLLPSSQSQDIGRNALKWWSIDYEILVAIESKVATLSLDQREALEKDAVKKEKKEEAKAEKEKLRIAVSNYSLSTALALLR